MGLPMYREPDVAQVQCATKKKVPTGIRRYRASRYPSNLRDRRRSSRPSYRRFRNAAQLDAELRGGGGGGEHEFASGRLSALRDVEGEVEADIAHSHAVQRRRLEEGRALLRDALSYERPSRRIEGLRDEPHNSGSPPLPVLSPDATSYPARRNDSAHRSQNYTLLQEGRGTRRESSDYMPTPPYTSEDTSNRSPQRDTGPPPYSTASYTPRFAPAHGLHSATTQHHEHPPILETDTGSGDGDLDDFPPLQSFRSRRAPRLPRPSQRSIPDYIDGLGDRHRSFSPEDDSWETLLTTITPDEHLPSASTSFTSGSASATSFTSDFTTGYGYGPRTGIAPSMLSYPAREYTPNCDDSNGDESASEDGLLHPAQGATRDPSREQEQEQEPQSRPTYPYPAGRSHAWNSAARSSERALPDSPHRRFLLEREEELSRIRASIDRLERQMPHDWWAVHRRHRDTHGYSHGHGHGRGRRSRERL